jgi:signal transduction histidine kinase
MQWMRRSLKRRILVTVGALVCPALALVGHFATEVSRHEFTRLVHIEPSVVAWREQQARQLAESIGPALDGVSDAGVPGRVEAVLARSVAPLGRGVVVLVTSVDGSFLAAYPSQGVRITPRAPDGTFVVEAAATPDARRSTRWRLLVPYGGVVVHGRTGQPHARVYVLEDPDARLRREAEFTRSVTGGVIVVVLLAGALSMGVAAALARRIVRPVEELTSLALRFGAGDLTARSHEIAPDEIGHLAWSFNEMADRLVQAEQVRRTMLTDIAHELRTPLTNVRCQLEAVQDGLLPATAETIGSLNDEVLSLMRVLDDLQDLALADAGRLRLHVEPCDIAVELRSLARASERPEGPSIAVHAPSSLVARVDPKRFRQIVRNLIANAVAALTPAGHVTVSAVAASEYVEIRVLDDGPGVPPEHLARVFDRYYRVTDRESHFGGTGLGLAIVKRLVELHGGTVAAAARPEGGMVFSLTLPGPAGPDPS